MKQQPAIANALLKKLCVLRSPAFADALCGKEVGIAASTTLHAALPECSGFLVVDRGSGYALPASCRAFGSLVRMVLQVVADMPPFATILFITVLAWASVFYPALMTTGAPFEGVGTAMLYMFNMLILGDFDMDDLAEGEYADLLRPLFVLGIIFTLIVLLNLLIAILSDSYERIQDQAEVPFCSHSHLLTYL